MGYLDYLAAFRYKHGLLGFILVTLLLGCMQPTIVDQPPSTILLLNESGRTVKHFTLSTFSEDPQQSSPLATLSAVPQRIENILWRASAPPPLPENFLAEWQDGFGSKFSKTVSVTRIIERLQKKPYDTMVVRIGPASIIELRFSNRNEKKEDLQKK